MSDFSHLDDNKNPRMVNVGNKAITKRIATACSTVMLGQAVFEQFSQNANELVGPKGPIFQTAIVAGIQAVKQTSSLIPMCHPLLIESVSIDIEIKPNFEVLVSCTVEISGKTGVEMEALTGASIAALTIYDMCKAVNPHIEIRDTKLVKKTGGKSDIKAE